MAKFDALVAIVVIIALTSLLLVWTDRRRKTRRVELERLKKENRLAINTLEKIYNELRLQALAGTGDTSMIQTILDEFKNRDLPTTTTRK